ncbi:MAG TPA: NUDIX domain-containing protein [Candidatus Limnocylindrales bacterium]
MNSPAVPRPAATVVLLRAGRRGLEVLLTKRPATMAFAPDVFVFPGGAIDAADGNAETAAIRELFEEAGVLLTEPSAEPSAEAPRPASIRRARRSLLDGTASMRDVAADLGVALRPDRLVPLSRWVTPPFVERRFDVRFFAAELPPRVRPSFVGDEVVEHRWMTPRSALQARAAGLLDLWVPTSATLQQLEHARSFDEVRERLTAGKSEPIRVDDVDEVAPRVTRLVMPGAGGVDGQSVNTYVVGTKELVVVDPGDPSDAAAETLLAVAAERSGRIAGIVVTSAAPDHHAGAEALAGRIDVPVFAGVGAARWLPYEVTELEDGDSVPVGDVELRVAATPGPRPEAISLLCDGIAFAGDLVGAVPSRSIVPEPDGAAVDASRARVRGRRLFAAHD